MNRSSQKTFTISQLAAQLEVSPHTIRFYEEKGLLSPERTSGNQRIYTGKERARLKLIKRGKRFGFSLNEIAEMIGMADTNVNERKQIQKSLDYGRRKLAEIEQRREELDLLEEDLVAMQQTLITRLEEI